ncbi:hypothetical protein FOCC_FOCC017876 [Frankliniella occidentalis]|nr:hypothetical protein FOCC_FOCC017876 [Frankliniella occidentalis]
MMLLLFAGFRSRTLAVSRFNNVAGPYRLIPDHAERCPVSEGGAGPLYKDIFWRGYHDRNNVNLWHYWINFTTLDNFDDSYDGYYEIKNISTEFSFKNVPVFFYGTWRITVRMLKAQTARACFRFFGKTVPK